MLIEKPRKIPRHFSEMIRDEFQMRALKNTNYSLRAFSRDLGLTSGNLSDLLKRKVGLSYEKALILCEKMKFTQEDEKLFLSLVKNSSSGQENSHPIINSDSSYMLIHDDYYQVLTEWHYFALVELVRIIGFQNDDEWIAKRLEIPQDEVREVIERLKRVELLTEENGVLAQTYDYFVSPSGTPSDTARKFHKQILNKAIAAVDTQKIEERDFTSGFLRVRTSDLPVVSQKIKEFRRGLASLLESGDEHDSVYMLSVQFFRGDKNSEEQLNA